MERDNKETMDQITEDANNEIAIIKKRQQDNENKVLQMTTTSKGEVQLTKNKLADVRQELKTLDRWIQDKDTMLKKQRANIEQLKVEWTEKKSQIDIKD